VLSTVNYAVIKRLYCTSDDNKITDTKSQLDYNHTNMPALCYKKCTASHGNPSHSYRASPAIWDHSVTCHLTGVNVPHLNLSQAGWYRFTHPTGMEWKAKSTWLDGYIPRWL